MGRLSEIYNLEQIKEKLKEGVTKDLLGDVIMIPNTESECIYWRVIDINHDNTTNTIDLQSVYSVKSLQFDTSTNQYEESMIRKWLNTDFYYGFVDIAKKLMIDMEVKTGIVTVHDKVKIISLEEMNFSTRDTYSKEGEIYLIYNHLLNRINHELNIIEKVSNLTRTASYKYNEDVYNIGPYGEINREKIISTFGISPIIRFSI